MIRTLSIRFTRPLSLFLLWVSALSDAATAAVPAAGGDARRAGGVSATPNGPPPSAVAATPPAGTNVIPTHHENNDAAVIPDVGFASTTITVSGAGTVIWDVDVTTFITHEWNPDLSFALQSPIGTYVLLSSGNGYDPFNDIGGADVFDGTFWDDHAHQISELVTDYLFNTGFTAPLLVPEAALAKFIGEDPNGDWILTVTDHVNDPFSPLGSLEGWALDIGTLDAPLSTDTVEATNAVAVPIANNQSGESVISIAGAGSSLCEVEVRTFLEHTRNGSLRIRLRSPAGTMVTLSTNNGHALDNVYNGTLWDDDALLPATDAAYSNNVTATWLVPEGALGKLAGENPNGDWRIEILQTTAPSDSGVLESWTLYLTTCAIVQPGEPYCFGDGLDPVVTAECPCSNFGDPGHGCANSGFASGGRLTASGTTNPNTVLFMLTQVPNNNLATGFMNLQNASAGVVFGDGVRCQAGGLFRFGSHDTGTLGDAPNTWSAPGLIQPAGQTRYYQVQYRNPSPVFCPPGTFNISNGYVITW